MGYTTLFLITGLTSAVLVGRIAVLDILERKAVNFPRLIFLLLIFIGSVIGSGLTGSHV